MPKENTIYNQLVRRNIPIGTTSPIPPQYRRDAAEAAIQTFKNHLLSGLATCDPQFPIIEWDRLLPQAQLTLNLLRNSKVNPKLSAWAHLNGTFDLNKTPLLPPGTKILVHSKPTNRKSGEFHGQQGWYGAPAPHHYRCVACYILVKHREIVSDTTKIIPNYVPIPQTNIGNFIREMLTTILQLLQARKPIISPT